MPIRLAINGFGRIGRQIARILLSQPQNNFELVAVNTLEDTLTSGHLFKHDTTYGTFAGQVETDSDHLIIDDIAVRFLRQSNPGKINWGEFKVDIVIECAGMVKYNPHMHLQNGVNKVVVTCSCTASDITICMGINQEMYEPQKHRVISASSCTANCLAPAVKVINDRFNIVQGVITFLHSYTNDQHLLDTSHHDLRRGRAALNNIVPTSSSGLTEIDKIIPELRGKINGLAMRVPTPLVHAADCTFMVKKRGSQQELLAAFDEAAIGVLRDILMVNRQPLVSSDFKGCSHSSIIDAEFTSFHHELVKVLIWHDNEFGYSSRIVDLLYYITTTNSTISAD